MPSRYFTLCKLWQPACGWCAGRDRIVVSTLRCGRNNPGSNPGHGRAVDFSVTARPVAFLKNSGPAEI